MRTSCKDLDVFLGRNIQAIFVTMVTWGIYNRSDNSDVTYTNHKGNI